MRFFQNSVIFGRVSESLSLLCGKDGTFFPLIRGTLSPLPAIHSPVRINCLFNRESRENLVVLVANVTEIVRP